MELFEWQFPRTWFDSVEAGLGQRRRFYSFRIKLTNEVCSEKWVLI